MKFSKNLLKTSTLLLLIASTGIIINSCETANDLLNNGAVGKLEGEWTCDETSEYFKTTATVYTVSISPDADNTSGIIIDNFYELGDVGVKATISGLSLTIASQTVEGGYTITGSGTIASDYKTINWSYTVDDGSASIDHVTAVYTK